MNYEHFPYIYDQGRWLRTDEPEDGLTWRGVAEAALGCFALCVCLTALAILVLCG